MDFNISYEGPEAIPEHAGASVAMRQETVLFPSISPCTRGKPQYWATLNLWAKRAKVHAEMRARDIPVTPDHLSKPAP